MPIASTTSAYPAAFGSHGSSMLVAPGSRCGRSTQPSMRITSTQTRLAHKKTMNIVSPSLTKNSQLCAYLRGETKAASARLLADLQNGQKRLLRDLDLPDLLHTLLAGFLLLEQLALARAMIWAPIAACTAMSNICRGMSSCILSTSSRPRA